MAKLPDGDLRFDRSEFGCSGATTHLLCQCALPEQASCSCRCDPVTDPECFSSLPLRNASGQVAGTVGPFGPLANGRAGRPGPVLEPYDPWIDLGFVDVAGDLTGDLGFSTGSGPPPP